MNCGDSQGADLGLIPMHAEGGIERSPLGLGRLRHLLPSGSVTKREMRAMSRQWQLYVLRMLGGAIGMAALVLLAVDWRIAPDQSFGFKVFNGLNVGIVLAILGVGPLLTADTIAEEKREGTLGLLFLTPLTPWEIVFSKFFAQALRAFSLVLAVFPLMALPVVFGGVTSQLILFSLAAQVAALLLALSAGMIASTLRRGWVEAVVTAEVICIGTALVIVLFRVPPPALLIGMLLGTCFALTYCASQLKKRWETEGSSYIPPVWIRLFSDSEFWRALFKWDTRKARDKNPIVWLQEYSWGARLAKWLWMAFACWSALFLLSRKAHFLFGVVVVLGLCLTAVLSFRQERETGALELLLVTPLTPGQIIFGRLWGIWVHFLPPMAVLQLPWIAPAILQQKTEYLFWHLSSYLFLPAVGMLFSLFRWNVLVAWMAVFVLGFFLPYQVAERVKSPAFRSDADHMMWAGIAYQGLLAAASVAVLFWGFKTRRLILPRNSS